MNAILNGPAHSPPPGKVSNFEDPINQDTAIWAVLSSMVVLPTIVGCVRLYTRAFLVRSVTYEDYAWIAEWVGQIAFTAAVIQFEKAGGGTHMWDIRRKDFINVLYWTNLFAILYSITNFLVKLSILLQYMRIFVPHRQNDNFMFVAIQVTLWSMVLFYTIMLFLQIFTCIPRERIWNRLIITGYCINTRNEVPLVGSVNTVYDVALLVLPIVRISKLQMSFKKKCGMIPVFATGALACFTSVMRTYTNWEAFFSQNSDSNWILVPLSLWTAAEIACGLFLSCVPTMPKFYQHFRSKVGNLSRSFQSVGESGHEFNSDNLSTEPRRSTHHPDRPYERYGGSSHISKNSNNSIDLLAERSEPISLEDLESMQSKGE